MALRRALSATLLAGCASIPRAAPSGPAPALSSAAPDSSAEASAPLFFYTGKTYGSEAAFNPLTELLNEGLDVLNEGGYDRHLQRQSLDVGLRTVVRSVTNPGKVVRAYGGFWNVVRNELLPLSGPGNGGGAWTGNYGLHLIGSGMVSARMREWYTLHGVPHPELAANVTLAATHVLNEVVEASRADGLREETLPDLFLFDGLGMWLYRFPQVGRLVSNDNVQLTNWPLQPAVVWPDSTIENVGQAFDLKVRIPRSSHWYLFSEMALAWQVGLSYRFDDGDALTVAGGPRVVGLTMVDSVTQKQTVSEWGKIASIYYDRNNSLLWSLVYDQGARLTRFNLYPGVLGIGGFSPGVFAQQRGSRVQFGIATKWGLGIGLGRPR